MLKRRIRITRWAATILVGLACLMIGALRPLPAEAEFSCKVWTEHESGCSSSSPAVAGDCFCEFVTKFWFQQDVQCGSVTFDPEARPPRYLKHWGFGNPDAIRTPIKGSQCTVCPTGQFPIADGRCACPEGTNFNGFHCAPFGPANCPTGFRWEDGPNMCIGDNTACRTGIDACRRTFDDDEAFYNELFNPYTGAGDEDSAWKQGGGFLTISSKRRAMRWLHRLEFKRCVAITTTCEVREPAGLFN